MNVDYTYRARCKRVVDGDTFVLDVDLGFNVRTHITVRLRGVNAYERSAAGGPEATAWTRSTIGEADLLVTSYHDKMTFARWVCDVKVLRVVGDTQPYDLAEAMVEAGHAVKYP